MVDERIDKIDIQWFGHIARMERTRNAKSVFMGGVDGKLFSGGKKLD